MHCSSLAVARASKATPVLVYLTMDCTIPRKSLESAQRELRQTKDGAGALFWLSWHHLPAVLRKASPTDEAQQTLLSDLRALISRRYGFGFFEGFGRVDVCESDWQFHGKPASDAPRPAIFDWQRQVRQSAWAFGEER